MVRNCLGGITVSLFIWFFCVDFSRVCLLVFYCLSCRLVGDAFFKFLCRLLVFSLFVGFSD